MVFNFTSVPTVISGPCVIFIVVKSGDPLPPIEVMTIEIKDKSDIDKARVLNTMLTRPVVHGVHIKTATLDVAKALKYEKVIGKLYNDCGCGWGAAIFIGTLSLCLYYQNLTPQSVLISTCVSIALAFAAKMVSLLISHHRLRRILSRLLEEVEDH